MPIKSKHKWLIGSTYAESYYKQIYPTCIKTSQGLGTTGVFEAWTGQVAIIINSESTNWQNKGIRLECMGSIMGCIGFMGCILLGTLVVFGLCIVWSVYGTKYHLIFMRTHILCIVFGAYIRSDVKRAHIGNIVQGTYAANTMHLIYEIHCIGSMYQVHYVRSTY